MPVCDGDWELLVCDCYSIPDTIGARDYMISEAFLRLFVETVGHYTEFVVTQQDGLLNFQVYV